MLCVTQLSAARVPPADLVTQAPMMSVQVADAGSITEAADTEFTLADLSSELSEPMLPMATPLSPEVRVVRPAALVAVLLPHPLIEGPQRPPRTFQA